MSAEPRQTAFPQDDTGTIRHLRPQNQQTASEPSEQASSENEQDQIADTIPDNSGQAEAKKKLPDKRILMAGAASGALVLLLAGFWGFHSSPSTMQPVGQEVGITAQTLPTPAVPQKHQPAPRSQPPVHVASRQETVEAKQAQPTDDLSAMIAAGPHPKTVQNTPAPPQSPPVQSREAEQAAAVDPVSPPPPLTPQTATETARHLIAAPMSSKDQIDVLQLVTMEAALVQNTRTEMLSLRQELQKERDEALKARADFTRRLALLEARKAVADATDLPNQARENAADQAKRALAAAMNSQQNSAPPPSASPSSLAPQAAPASEQPRTNHNWVPRYRIVSASPLLGMVQDDNAPSGEQSQYEVEPGTNLRGYGVVKSIYQAGTNWVIKTDHGLIN
ncbi:hypothetical protein [Acetobacter indonesiensis]|uniref:Uncharacterized protein n=1 Tax=Acetobacter indonesiensis TaxID=104101 RepID=A0A6N3T3U8_9PROT|nr:hypothetical protein [Acetobacter indonesiensis]GAN63309.1 hypothetical protein Abin_024_094 [Acetobacter indonesiensis]GEN03862.1 hypothetical protein AIN02nite_18870 [Acetobacter indonesiensis]